jgi:ABC-type transport system substrate-binding protein
VASWDRQQQLTLEANPDYWGTAPQVKTAIIKVLPQQSQQVIEYQGGNLDVAWVSEADLPTIQADADLSKQVLKIPLLGTWHLRVNLNDPVLGKLEVRQAFSMAIDRQAIVDTILQGQGSPAVTLTAPGMNGYDPNLNDFPHDIAKAKDLLAQAGYPDGVDITVRTQQVETENRVLAAIQQQVAEAGIRLTVNSTESGVYTQDRTTCNMQLGSIGWTNDYPDADDILPLVASAGGGRGACGYDGSKVPAIKQIDDLLAQGSKLPVGPDRDKLYAEADKIAMDNVLVIPVYHPTRSVLVNPRLGGVTVDADSIVRYDLMTVAS